MANALMQTRRNAKGEIDPYASDWTSGSWSGMVDPNATANGLGSDAVAKTGFQYNPQLMEQDWWKQQGFQGNAFQTGQGEYRFDQPTMTPELEAWAAANGYAPGFTDGYGGILKDGQIQPGTAQGNRTNDDRAIIAAQLGLMGVGAYANAAGVGSTGAEAAGAIPDIPLDELAQMPAEFGGFQNVGAGADAATIGGYGEGMSGAATGTYDAGIGSGWMDSIGSFLGSGNASDYGRLAQTLVGLYSNNRATNAAQQGAQDQNALIREAMAKNQPLIDTRDKALGGINALMADPSSVAKQPDYQFGLNQGQSQIDNQAAARGGYYSGQQLKASQKFGQDYAGTKLDQSLNRLMGVAGLGQIGSNQNNGLTLNLGQGMANAGNIRGSGYMGQGNIVGSGIGDWVNDWTNRKTWGGGG